MEAIKMLRGSRVYFNNSYLVSLNNQAQTVLKARNRAHSQALNEPEISCSPTSGVCKCDESIETQRYWTHDHRISTDRPNQRERFERRTISRSISMSLTVCFEHTMQLISSFQRHKARPRVNFDYKSRVKDTSTRLWRQFVNHWIVISFH